MVISVASTSGALFSDIVFTSFRKAGEKLKSKDYIQFTARIPSDLHGRLRYIAADKNESMNETIIQRHPFVFCFEIAEINYSTGTGKIPDFDRRNDGEILGLQERKK